MNLLAPFAGTVVSVPHAIDETISADTPVIVLEAIEDPAERERAFDAAVAGAYESGRGISMASYFEIDDVIDPANSRRWIATLLHERAPRWWERPGKRRPNVDAWQPRRTSRSVRRRRGAARHGSRPGSRAGPRAR